MEFDTAARSYLTGPSAETLRDLQAVITAHPTFAPYAEFREQAVEHLEAGRARVVLDELEASMPGLFLSPSAHSLLARAHRALNDDEGAERELSLAQVALRTILDSGTGSQAAPWKVLRLSDEYDVLELTERRSVTQSAVQVGDSFLDVHTCDDGSTASFLVVGAVRYALREPQS